ncbi:MAG TPA: MoaD/ThiS family protein [Desulfatiglandales bacterium]|nr:MoaD/ThiS family protein [Desulfatiglandales bacterium]
MSDGLSDRQETTKERSHRAITVTVKLSGFLTRITPAGPFEVALDTGSTVADLVGLLAERLGDGFRKAVIDRRGGLHGGIMLVLNGEPVPPRGITETAIDRESDFAIIPVIDGG